MATVSSSFDPYHKWLGIRDQQRPPSHYRLLGLENFEDDMEVIRDAAGRAIAHVRSYRVGANRDLAQQVLDELAAAKETLLNPVQKAAYDKSLLLLSRNSSIEETAPSTPAARTVLPIRCPKCSRENDPDRKFCGRCGQSLTEPCIACGARVSADEEHCGHCGIFLPQAIQQRLHDAQSKLLEARSLRHSGRHEDAIALLQSITSLEHSRLAECRQQAQQLGESLRNEFDSFRNRVGDILTQAQQRFEAFDYDAAIQLIEQIPEAIRNTELNRLLVEARSRQIEILTLLAVIRDRVASKQTSGLLEKVERLLEIKPDHPQGLTLAEQLRPLEQQRLQRECQRRCKKAQAEVAEYRYAEAVATLEKLPPSTITQQIQKFIDSTRAKADEAAWLFDDLRQAVAFDKQLPAIAQRYLDLMPNDQRAQQFVAAIKSQQQHPRTSAGASGSAAVWPAPPTRSYWGFPVVPVRSFRNLQFEKDAQPLLIEHSSSFSVAIGLALQGLGVAAISTNLLPPETGGVRSMLKRVTKRKSASSAWGIDIGRYALKAIKLTAGANARPTVDAVHYIKYEKLPSSSASLPADAQVLGASSATSQSAAAQSTSAQTLALQQAALRTLLQRQPLRDDFICASISSQLVLTKSFRTPVMETKKVADLMRYEAAQQIPFPLEHVHHVWQLIGSPAPSNVPVEHEVGLFAIKHLDVSPYLAALEAAGIRVDILQSDSVALHNCIAHEQSAAAAATDGASPAVASASSDVYAVLDIGADASNLVIAGPNTFSTRRIPIGGSALTRAIVKRLGLTHDQAEALKQKPTAARYLHELYGAMQPVLHDLVLELQRSFEYFTSTAPAAVAAPADRKPAQPIRRLFVTGPTTNMHGLLRILNHGS